MENIWIDGIWRPAQATGSFHAFDPSTGRELAPAYPISGWEDCDAALTAAAGAAEELRTISAETIARFLESYAERIEVAADDVCAIAHQETGLPLSPRLRQVELKRTTNQLRQAADAARDGSWSMPTIDAANKLRSVYAAIGPVLVLGPNNFPLAFNGIAGGDFASAIAAGNPVIAKGHPSHPGTTRALARLAAAALAESGLPAATCQMLYHVPPDVGLRWVADPRLGALGFTGSRAGGLALKAACDAVGKPAYLEMSSNNPVVILPAALRKHGKNIADQLVSSCTAAAGQMCTSPGLVFGVASPEWEQFTEHVTQQFQKLPAGTLLSKPVLQSLEQSVNKVIAAGATLLTGGHAVAGNRWAFENTLLRISAAQFARHPEEFQTEMFGTATLLITVERPLDMPILLKLLHGNLTGAIYTDESGEDESLYRLVAAVLRPKVGRLMNDKMPTGVVVSPAMQHGGPYPATGHAGFTSVGIPAALRRFAALQCFDHVPDARLPVALRDKNPNGRMIRCVDGQWTSADVTH